MWVITELTTYDVVFIPLARTTNTTTLTLYDGGGTLSGNVDCWVANPSPVNTHWYTQTCRIIPQIWEDYSYTLGYHRAYNDDFPVLPRVTARHWTYARFDHTVPRGWSQWTWDISPDSAVPLLITGVTAQGSGGTC